MQEKPIYLALMFCLTLCACAFMMNLDEGYASKDVQKSLKELGALVDTLKYQDAEHYTYRILATNADKMIEASSAMTRKAPDSYYIRMAKELGRQAHELQEAATRGNTVATRDAIKEILRVWGVLEQYRKPA